MAQTPTLNEHAAGVVKSTPKKVCLVCEQEFDLTDFFIHLQEENLKQLQRLHVALQDIKDVLELTYTYMEEEDDEMKIVAEENKKAAQSITDNINAVKTNKTLPMQNTEFSALMSAVQDKVKNSLKE